MLLRVVKSSTRRILLVPQLHPPTQHMRTCTLDLFGNLLPGKILVQILPTICHGPQLLIEAGVVAGKEATCYVSVSTDLKNAGGKYLDKSVVVDGTLVTSRFPADLPDFCREAVKLLV